MSCPQSSLMQRISIGLENERKEALESEVNVLKRKQEALELTCQEKNVKLKRLRSSEHYQIEKNKKLEKQQSKFGVMEKLFHRYLDILHGIIQCMMVTRVCTHIN